MTTRPQRSRWMFGAFSLALLLFVGWLAFNRPITTSLPDGTTFELNYLNVGLTNEIVHGTILGRVVESWIPPNGWKVGKFEVKRPQRLTLHNQGRSDLLVAAIKLRPGSPREKDLLLPSPDHPLRFQIVGDDGYGYVESYATFKTYDDGAFAHVFRPRYPRDSATLRFRLEERHPQAPTGWREIATLIAPNPKPTSPQSWSVEPGQRIRLADDLEIELGNLTISTKVPYSQELWVNRALLPVRFWKDGQVATNWGLQYGSIRDALGNFDSTTFSAIPTNEWVLHPIPRSLSSTVPWRFDTHVARVANFPETNLFKFALHAPTSLTTNAGGTIAKLSFPASGEVTVELQGRPADVRLSLVSARVINGEAFDRNVSAFNQHYFSKLLSPRTGNSTGQPRVPPRPKVLPQNPAPVEVTIAIHPNYPVQFTLQPRLDSALPPMPGQ